MPKAVISGLPPTPIAQKQPKIMIAPDDWEKLNPSASSPNARPLIAFLMGRENGFYLMLENYVRALAQTGVDLKILTHCDGPDALNDVDGLILPGRLDDPLNTFAAPSLPKKPVLCSLTYVNMVREAEKRGIPVLGIAAPVVIGHGVSTPVAIKNMILETEKVVKCNLVGKLKNALDEEKNKVE